MSTGIGASAAIEAGTGQPSRLALDAEIARYKKQLADCINCSSSKTPEGKANIQELENRISVDQGRVRRLDSAAPAAAQNSGDPTTGILLDVFA